MTKIKGLRPIKLATTFSGIGAIEFTLRKMGLPHSIVFAGDIDEKCRETYFANYKIKKNQWHSDITKFNAEKYLNQVDLLVGGSPCQAFSTNGKRAGLNDTRGTLFYDYARVISECQPKCFIFENVKGLLMNDGGRTWAITKSVFEGLNYHIYINLDKDGKESPLLNAADYGIPQNRYRIYLVGIRNDIQGLKPFEFPQKIKLEKVVSDFLEETVDAKYYLGEKGFSFVTTHPTRAQVACDVMKCQKRIQQYNWNGDFVFEPLSKVVNRQDVMDRAYVGTFKGETGVIRRLTPIECLRLMGYDDSFIRLHNDTIMYNQAGNSIVINVLEALIVELKKTGVFNND